MLTTTTLSIGINFRDIGRMLQIKPPIGRSLKDIQQRIGRYSRVLPLLVATGIDLVGIVFIPYYYNESVKRLYPKSKNQKAIFVRLLNIAREEPGEEATVLIDSNSDYNINANNTAEPVDNAVAATTRKRAAKEKQQFWTKAEEAIRTNILDIWIEVYNYQRVVSLERSYYRRVILKYLGENRCIYPITITIASR